MTNRKRLLAVVVFVVMFVLCFASLAACEQPHEHTLKAYTGVAATCTADGVDAYWQCTDETCNKYFSDSEGTTEIAEPKTIAKLGHIDEDKNFKCDRCGVALCEHKTIVKVAAVEATCTTTGTGEYYKCSDCGQMYKDAEGKTKLASVPVIPAKNHSFEDRICTACNARLFEAEDATILSQSNNEDPVIQDTDVASGGKIVGQFAVEGNKLTWIFTLDKAASNVGITMMLSPCEGTPHTLGTDIVINVNDQAVEWKDTVLTPISAPEAWHDYRPFATMSNISLKEGTNKIEFVGVVAINVNIDCMIVSGIDKDAVINDAHVHQMNHVEAVAATCTTDGNKEYWQCTECERKYADEAGSAELTDVTVKASHDFGNGATCSRCHALKLEAEDLEVVGTPTWNNNSFYARPSAEEVEQKGATGTGWVENWGNGDNLMYVRITTDKAVSGAKLRIRAACWTNGANPLLIYLKKADTKVAITLDLSQLSIVSNGYYNWSYVLTEAFDLVAGDNVIVIEANNNISFNFDYVVVENIGDATISVTHVCQDPCETCGKCTSDCEDSHCADKCKCNEVTTVKTKLEVEDSARISGSYEIGSNVAASGGKLIGGWDQAYANSKFRIYFTASKAASNVQFEICASTFAYGGYLPGPDDAISGDNAFYFIVNNAEGGIKFVKHYDLKSGQDWHVYDCFYVTVPVDITEGLNYITIVGVSKVGINFDYVNVIAPEDVTITIAHVCQHKCEVCGGCKDNDCTNAVCANNRCTCVVHEHAYTDGVCECGAKQVTLEAELATILPVSNNEDSIFKSPDGASGGKSIGQFAVVGNTITWVVKMDKQADNLCFVMKLSSCEGSDKTLGVDLVIKINGVAVEWSDVKLPHIVNDEWHVYRPYATLANISLKDGDIIEFVNVNGINVNVDCLVVEGVPEDTTLTAEPTRTAE